jgi:hypothetical protein
MKITETVEHAATPDQVFAAFCDEGYQVLKCQRSGALEHDVVIELEDGQTIIVTRRQLPTEGFPDFVRGFVGDRVEVVETQRWGDPGDDGAREAALTVEIPRTPVTLTGGVHLRPGGPGTVQAVDGELKANVPLLGGRIEKAVAPVIVSAVRLEAKVVRDWLARD